MKIIPVYLPQFHAIPENDEWWGKGFTEWVNVKAARPLYQGHRQPRVPLDEYYYDLTDLETLKWQCQIARDHGIYGFCMYHYWFNGHLLLEKPMEMLLKHPEIDIKYCISWANHDWTDAWKAKDGMHRTLIAHDFDDESDWVNHFNYMLPFFRDSRYMLEDGKPIMVIYVPNLIRKLNKMLDLWTQMALDAGFSGLTYVFQSAAAAYDTSWDKSRFTYGVEMNPQYANLVRAKSARNLWERIMPQVMRYIRPIKNALGIRRSMMISTRKNELRREDYDECWERILSLPKREDIKMIPCAFTDWDNTPRHRMRGYAFDGVSVDKFKGYFARLVEKSKRDYQTDMMFVFAWNEWAEGGYLEPDEENRYGFLSAIKEVLDSRYNAID